MAEIHYDSTIKMLDDAITGLFPVTQKEQETNSCPFDFYKFFYSLTELISSSIASRIVPAA